MSLHCLFSFEMNSALIIALCLTAFKFVQSTPLGVVDGNDVKPNSIPFQTHIKLMGDFGSQWNCSGVLISENFILTTSKCEWSGATHIIATLGAHNIAKAESSQQFISAKSKDGWKIYKNDFNYTTLDNNVALIRLPSPAKLSAKVQIATLPDKDNVVVSQGGIISGWGVDGSSGSLETTLKSASVTVVNASVCASAYPTLYSGPKTICTQGGRGGAACKYDGGAPLVIDGVVVGIFSGGPVYIPDTRVDSCVGKPNIFTKVFSYIDWIKNHSDL